MRDAEHGVAGRALRVVFFGTPDFSVPVLARLCAMPSVEVVLAVTQPDRPAGRGKQLQPSPIKRFAVEHGLPVYQPTSLRRELPAALEQFSSSGPLDIGIVIAFGQILPPEILAFPRCGCLNIHASLLPRWRGAAPIHRAILAGDRETGVCLMQMDAGLDTGAVFTRIETPITSEDDTGALHDRLAVMGADIVERDLDKILAGALNATPQPPEGITYAEKIRGEEAEIDWNDDAGSIARKVRAMSPSPGAFTFLRGQRLKIFSASAETSTAGGPAGTVHSGRGPNVEVYCGTGLLAVRELQLEGKRRMAADEYLRGSGEIPSGTRLGKI